MNPTISQDELFEIVEVKQQTKLIHWLNQRKIRFDYTAKKNVFVTLDQFNAHYSGKQKRNIVIGHGQKS